MSRSLFAAGKPARRSARLAGLAVLAVLAAASLLAGCSTELPTSTPLAGGAPGPDPSGKVDGTAPPDTINDYVVTYLGRTVAAGTTTFTWTVSGTGVEPALSHFMVELPDCAPAPVAYEPTGSVSINLDPSTGIYGLEWHLRVEPDDLVGRTYSITFPGDIPEGVVLGAVKTGDLAGVGEIPGPCAGYLVAGAVFVDADEDGFRDPGEESGIANVIVELVRADGRVYSAVTDPWGRYSFRRSAGDYTVRIRTASGSESFNVQLAESFAPTSPSELLVTVPPDRLDVNFGYSPLEEELILDLETGVLLSDGQSVKFWKSEMRSALRGGNGNAVHDPATLLGYLADVQALFLAAPFAFTPGNELAEAYDILGGNPRTSLEILRQELLALELNEVSGRGLIGQDELQLVLIAWGEALVADSEAQPVPAGDAAILGGGADKGGIGGSSTLDRAAELFRLVNDTGGGGGVDE